VQTNTQEITGLLLVDKPGLTEQRQDAPSSAGLPTSHDVVQRVRRWSRQRRIGHTGTLDPMASGLLVLCLGWATRLVEYYQGHDKHYRAEVTLGYATDTYDALGEVTERASVPVLNIARIEAALELFRGTVAQKPPVYSALKQGGESLHYKARRGEEVVVPERAATFHAVDLLAFTAPDRLLLNVHCSAGAYIRSLAHDLGRALGTCGTLTALRRIAAGPFAVGQAHSLATIEAAATEGRLTELLLPSGTGLDLPTVTGDADVAQRLGFGQIEPLESGPHSVEDSELAQYIDANGTLLGIVRLVHPQGPDGAPAFWKAEKWFA
jgi:tRNA pseudouridine55 synthase